MSGPSSKDLSNFNINSGASLVVKNPPTVQEARVQSLGQEEPLEKEMATHSCSLA